MSKFLLNAWINHKAATGQTAANFPAFVYARRASFRAIGLNRVIAAYPQIFAL